MSQQPAEILSLLVEDDKFTFTQEEGITEEVTDRAKSKDEEETTPQKIDYKGIL